MPATVSGAGGNGPHSVISAGPRDRQGHPSLDHVALWVTTLNISMTQHQTDVSRRSLAAGTT
jgi:hypothetical protein